LISGHSTHDIWRASDPLFHDRRKVLSNSIKRLIYVFEYRP
jgi:hypothetical protein